MDDRNERNDRRRSGNGSRLRPNHSTDATHPPDAGSHERGQREPAHGRHDDRHQSDRGSRENR